MNPFKGFVILRSYSQQYRRQSKNTAWSTYLIFTKFCEVFFKVLLVFLSVLLTAHKSMSNELSLTHTDILYLESVPESLKHLWSQQQTTSHCTVHTNNWALGDHIKTLKTGLLHFSSVWSLSLKTEYYST